MLDLIVDVIGALLEAAWTDWRPTRRQRVKRAWRLSRSERLSGKQHEFALTWLNFALDNLSGLRLESREADIRAALQRVQESQIGQR